MPDNNNRLIEFTKWLLKRIAIALFGLIVLIVLIVMYSSIEDKWQNRAKVISSLQGISLHEKLDDVIFKHGKFSHGALTPDEQAELNSLEAANSSKKNEGMAASKEDAKLENLDEEDFINSSGSVVISVKDKKVVSIKYFCQTDYDITSVNGISCNDPGDKIIEKFGDDVRIQCGKKENENDELAKLVRVYDTVGYGVRYLLAQNHVKAFMVADEKLLESYVGIHWEKCK